jgi:amidase
MVLDAFDRSDGLALARLVACGEATPVELLEESIARAERRNPALNAIIFKDYERARQTAKGELPKGLFTGVPFLLKDIALTHKGTPTRQGSRFFPPFPADHDSHLMARFRKAGLVSFGKTNVPEFGLVPTTEGKLYGAAHNPWNLAHSPGGSSGGAAAAVAAGIVPLAHANDGGGSIRIPASCCGLVGLKPSRGRVSAGPDLPDAVDGLSIELAVTRSVRDAAAILDAAAGYEPGDPYTAPPAPASYLAAAQRPPRSLRIGYAARKLDGTAVHADCRAAVEHAAALCRDLGHAVEEASPDIELALLLPAFTALWCSNLAAIVDFIARLTGQTPGLDNLEPLTLAYYEKGKAVTASQYIQGKMMLHQAGRIAALFHAQYDLWLTPVLGAPPAKLGTIDSNQSDAEKALAALADYVPFTPIQNITGQPAIALPLYWNAAGLPVGVQFAGAYGDELTLLQLATQLEQSQPWFERYRAIIL